MYSECSFEEFMALLGELALPLGDEMVKYLKNKYILGNERALNITCEEAQATLIESFQTRTLPEDIDFVVAFIGHVCICRECSNYLCQLMEKFNVEQLLEGGDHE